MTFIALLIFLCTIVNMVNTCWWTYVNYHYYMDDGYDSFQHRFQRIAVICSFVTFGFALSRLHLHFT